MAYSTAVTKDGADILNWTQKKSYVSPFRLAKTDCDIPGLSQQLLAVLHVWLSIHITAWNYCYMIYTILIATQTHNGDYHMYIHYSYLKMKWMTSHSICVYKIHTYMYHIYIISYILHSRYVFYVELSKNTWMWFSKIHQQWLDLRLVPSTTQTIKQQVYKKIPIRLLRRIQKRTPIWWHYSSNMAYYWLLRNISHMM